MQTKRQIVSLYRSLLKEYGPQHWWPADTPFEVMVGAILTQNTAWTNVEKAIDNLKQENAVNPETILSLPQDKLALLLKPSGYFNIKAKRLRNFCKWFLQQGGQKKLGKLETEILRKKLLSVNGVGPETADDMMLYAFERPVFVVDAYTRRLFERQGILQGGEPYDVIRLLVEDALDRSIPDMNEFHALIVNHAKDYCRKKPVCEGCTVQKKCEQIT